MSVLWAGPVTRFVSDVLISLWFNLCYQSSHQILKKRSNWYKSEERPFRCSVFPFVLTCSVHQLNPLQNGLSYHWHASLYSSRTAYIRPCGRDLCRSLVAKQKSCKKVKWDKVKDKLTFRKPGEEFIELK